MTVPGSGSQEPCIQYKQVWAGAGTRSGAGRRRAGRLCEVFI